MTRPLADDLHPAWAQHLGPELELIEGLVADGHYTRDEALAFLRDLEGLADATEEGEITLEQGGDLVEQMSLAMRDGRPS